MRLRVSWIHSTQSDALLLYKKTDSFPEQERMSCRFTLSSISCHTFNTQLYFPISDHARYYLLIKAWPFWTDFSTLSYDPSRCSGAYAPEGNCLVINLDMHSYSQNLIKLNWRYTINRLMSKHKNQLLPRNRREWTGSTNPCWKRDCGSQMKSHEGLENHAVENTTSEL